MKKYESPWFFLGEKNEIRLKAIENLKDPKHPLYEKYKEIEDRKRKELEQQDIENKGKGWRTA